MNPPDGFDGMGSPVVQEAEAPLPDGIGERVSLPMPEAVAHVLVSLDDVIEERADGARLVFVVVGVEDGPVVVVFVEPEPAFGVRNATAPSQ